ncbi:MAG TPA: VOC family protein [Candidatus Aquilonibacter sp.]|nr:VOC family protein [Candidatus Aquilonibacter sp.]
MANLVQTTPFMHVPIEQLESAVRFFEQVLGFNSHTRMRDYAYMERDGCAIRIWGRADAADAPRGQRNFRYYFDVRDVDALYEELKPQLDQLPDGHVHGPADKTYHQRELLVLAPDGDLVCFGQRL